MLMSRGARVHTTNMGDDTPLHLAAAFGNRDIVLMVIWQTNKESVLIHCELILLNLSYSVFSYDSALLIRY